MPPKNSRKSSQKLVFSIPVLPGQRRQRHDPSRSFPVDLRCQHGSTRFTQFGLPFPVLQGSPRWFLTCQKPPERPPVHPGPSGIIPVHHGEFPTHHPLFIALPFDFVLCGLIICFVNLYLLYFFVYEVPVCGCYFPTFPACIVIQHYIFGFVLKALLTTIHGVVLLLQETEPLCKI